MPSDHRQRIGASGVALNGTSALRKGSGSAAVSHGNLARAWPF